MPSRKSPPECASGNWSDGETSTLIDAWGPAHLRRQPRHLLLKDWRAAASVVNAHRAAAGRRFNRTRAQCQTRIRTLKKRYKEELSRRPPSGWPHLPQLRAFLVDTDGPPPGFPARTPARVKREVKEEEEEVGGGSGCGLAGSWTVVPRRPRNAGAGSTGLCPATVVMNLAAAVTKLAEVYERVDMARIGAEKDKMEMEVQQAMLDAVKMDQLKLETVPAPPTATRSLGSSSSARQARRQPAKISCPTVATHPLPSAAPRATVTTRVPLAKVTSASFARAQAKPSERTPPCRAADARIIHAPTYSVYIHAPDVTTRFRWGRNTTDRSIDRSIAQQHKHHTPLTAAPHPPGLATPRLASLSLSLSLSRPARPPAARMSSSTRRRPLPPPPAWTPEPWSDGETSALLDAWGPSHLRARGGARRPKAGRAPRTVDQCKNRVDYLKKRLRAERARPRGAPPPPPPVSGWLDRLRALLHLAPSAPPGFAHRLGAKVKEEDENGDDKRPSGGAPLPRDWPPVPKRPRTAVSLSPLSAASGEHPEGGGRSCTEVAAALDRLAGTYERVEAAKQREATRLEERRLEAMRDLEIERMRLLVDVAVTASVGVDGAAAAATAGGDF
ncbi:hypothetical protein BAE44_0009428 [Dichanthelium oligosanthes]|uniref:Myb/SANT-like DNA-binding domain-containing protein n=1 Tax=Dichanthelium oligosanthes TaxID=888268 RepID=A0A1E5VWR8_9POAL|nr:hypothetical protein BAE44_0009428 [Dichanthelium oligosanthes]